MAKKLDNADQPWIENYPPLHAWIKEHGHSCLWDAPTNGQCRAECWLLSNLEPVIITVRPKRQGWDVYTCARTNKIEETFRDALVRTGLVTPPPPPTFEEVWSGKEAEGYRYGRDALENVRFGFELGRGEKGTIPVSSLTTDLADQLAWFRREHTIAEPILAAVRMSRNGRMTGAEILSFLSSEAVDKFLRFREPTVAPHLSSDAVNRELVRARERVFSAGVHDDDDPDAGVKS